jgi:hypothetical protein
MSTPSKSQSKQEGVKKGKPSWKPASLNEFFDKEPGYRYRMVRKDPTNLAKKAAEGWETVSGIQSAQTAHDAPGRVHDGKPLTSVQEGHDWVLQRLPEDLAQGRDEYHAEKANRQVRGLTAHLKKEMRDKGGDAPVHGDITISSRKGTQVLE